MSDTIQGHPLPEHIAHTFAAAAKDGIPAIAVREIVIADVKAAGITGVDVGQLVDAEQARREPGFLARHVGEALKIRRGDDGQLYRYNPERGIYVNDGGQYVGHYVKKMLGDKVRSRHMVETRAILGDGLPDLLLSDANSTEYLCLANGLLRWSDLALIPHSPEHIYTYQVPWNWEPEATCPGIDAFLERILPNAEIRAFIAEWAGYGLRPGNHYKAALILTGQGENGKSVLLDLLHDLYGQVNVSAVALQEIAEDRFSRYRLVGKLANIVGDLPDTPYGASATFKKITGGDDIGVQRKHVDGFEYRVPGKLMFSANRIPKAADTAKAYFNRLHVVPFTVVIPPEERDHDLREKLTTPAEMEGLLVMAVHAAKRLMERPGFDLPVAVKDAVRGHEVDANSVLSWIEDECEIVPGSKVDRRKLYVAFKKYTFDAGRGTLRDRGFYEALRECPGVSEKKNREGFFEFHGLKLGKSKSIPFT